MKRFAARRTPFSRLALSLLALLLIGVVTLLPQGAAQAAVTIVVDTGSDANLTTCSSAANDCSLRGAINDANVISGTDTITFDPAVFNPGTINLSSSLPQITTNMNITGLGETKTIINGITNNRVFDIGSGTTVTISGLTIQNGSAPFNDGGGIYNDGTLTVSSSIFSGNSATNGAGIFNNNILTVINSAFVGNTATVGGGLGVNGQTTVINSTFSGNSASSAGADIGAVIGSLTLSNSIFANSAMHSDCVKTGSVTTNIHNTLIEDGSCGVTNGVSGNLTGDPSLVNDTTNLALNLGSKAINAGDNSLAVDQNQSPLVYDVRGAGFPRKLGGTVDMGAYESCAFGFPYTVAAGDTTDLINTMTCANTNGAGTNDTINLTAGSTYTLTTANNYDGSASNALPVIVSGNGSLTINGNGATIARSSAGGTPEFRLFRVISGANLTITGLTLSNGNVISTNFGGAITNVGGTVTVLSSVFMDNQGAAGGAVFNNSGTLMVTNSAFVHNNATSGGGIGVGGGTVLVNDSTFSANSASNAGASILVSSATSITVNNSILANSTAGGECASNVAVTVQNSLIEDGSCGITNGVNGNKTGDPSLVNDTTNLALNLNSKAINAGDNSLIPGGTTTDLAGNARIYGDRVDMGAYEKVYTPDFVVDTTSDANLSVCTSAANDCSLRGAINLANSIAGMDTISFDASVFNPGTITLTSSLPANSTDMNITGLGATKVIVDGANSYQPFVVNSGTTVSISGMTLTHGSGGNGGAILNDGTLTVTGVSFSSNTADNGGGIFADSGTLTVINSAFSGNSSTTGGGVGINDGDATITNSTFSANSASVYGGGFIVFAGNLTLNNSIVANSTSGGDCVSNVTLDIHNSLIEDGSCGITTGIDGNLTGDPKLNNDLTNLTLKAASKAINAGDNSLIPGGITTDLAGNARIRGGTVDMGAYEASAVCPTFPHTVAAGNVADLILSIACANSNAAGTNDVINLTNSTYTLTAVNNSDGSDGSNGLPSIVDVAVSGTLTIHGNGATIARSSASGTPEFRFFYFNSGANLTLDRLTLTNGLVNDHSGGALNVGDGTLTLTNSTVNANGATLGGGIFLYHGALTIVNSTLSNNVAQSYGGAIATDSGSTFKLINSTISTNSVTNSGSSDGGGALDLYAATTTIINSTIANNTAADAARSGLWLDTGGTLTIQNSIVANNNGANNCQKDSGTTFTDNGNNLDNGTSCGFGGSVGQNTNPLLGALANNGGSTQTIALQAGSPAINAGSNALAVGASSNPLTTDQRGTGFPRVFGGTVDIGAFELSYSPNFVVDTTSDANLQGCTSLANDCSLRGAITLANSIAGTDTITFKPSIFVPGTITLTNDLPDISTNLNITGLGADQVIVDGANGHLVFFIDSSTTVNISGLTITHGSAVSGSAVFNNGTLTVTSSTLSGNTADGAGGALWNGGTLTLTNSTVSGNTAAHGGGIYNTGGTLTLTNSTLSGNSSTGEGGGIENFAALTMTGSTLSGNTAANYGGGIANGSTLKIINSTLSGNAANGPDAGSDGGGALDSFGGSVLIINSTIANNTAVQTEQSGLWLEAGTLTIQNSIVANNNGANNCSVSGSTFTDNGHNLDNGTTCGFGGAVGQNTNPLLGALANNGGSTLTLALGAGSPAINAGSNALAVDASSNPLTTDQRGAGFPRINSGTVDIGAYESSASPNLLLNGDFSDGLNHWGTFGQITYQVSGGVFQFYRNSGGASAVVLQNTNTALPSGAPLTVSLDLGNSSNVRKRAVVLVHEIDFTDLQVCSFWIPPNTPLRTYHITAKTTKAWTNAYLSVYAAPADGLGYILLDNVDYEYHPELTVHETLCVDPAAPAPGVGADGANMITNGSFSGGLTPWATFGHIASQIMGGVFQFYKTTGTPSGVVLQNTGIPVAGGVPVEAQFDLGNSSNIRMRATILLQAADFSDLQVCTFWIPPNAPLQHYVMRTFSTQAWGGATVSVYPSTAAASGWTLLDNVSLVTRPTLSVSGTECYEPGSSVAGAVQPVAELPESGRQIAPPVSAPPELPEVGSQSPGEEPQHVPSGDTGGLDAPPPGSQP